MPAVIAQETNSTAAWSVFPSLVLSVYGGAWMMSAGIDRKSTRLNSSHTEIYTLSLHDALPIYARSHRAGDELDRGLERLPLARAVGLRRRLDDVGGHRSEEHTSELQSHRDLHSFPTRRSSDLCPQSSRRRRTRPRPGASSPRSCCRSTAAPG